MEEKLLTRKEVANKLRVSIVTLNKLRQNKTLPSYKIGGSVRFKESEVNELFKSNKA